MNWKERYKEAHRKFQEKEYPASTKDFGWINPVYPDVRTANGKNRFLTYYLKWEGWMADRTNSTGIPMTHKIPKYDIFNKKMVYLTVMRGWRKQNSKNGRGDVTAIIKGIYCLFETKTPHDRLSDDQKDFHEDVRKAGGQAIVVDDIDNDFFPWYDQFLLSLK